MINRSEMTLLVCFSVLTLSCTQDQTKEGCVGCAASSANMSLEGSQEQPDENDPPEGTGRHGAEQGAGLRPTEQSTDDAGRGPRVTQKN